MVRIVVALLAVIVALVPAQAQDAYPTKPVRIVVAAAPGGNPDILGRLLAERLSIAFGQPFVVENVPGAGGVVASRQVASAAPDGHVLYFGDSGAMAINVALNPKLSYDPLRDFTAITALATVPTVLVAHPSVPARTLPEFVALAKANPGGMNYASAGPGSIHHFTHEVFAHRAGIRLQHIPFRGGTALVNGILTGNVHVGWSGIPNVKPLIESGKLRVYCISTLDRSQAMPEVQPCAEFGYPGFDLASMMGVQAPAGLPRRIVVTLQAAIAKALREPDIVERMTVLGMQMRENGTAAYEAFMREDIDRYVTAVKQIGIQVQQ